MWGHTLGGHYWTRNSWQQVRHALCKVNLTWESPAHVPRTAIPHSPIAASMVGLWVHNPPTLFEFVMVASLWVLVLVPVQGAHPIFYRPVSRAQPSTWLGQVKPKPGGKAGQGQQAWPHTCCGSLTGQLHGQSALFSACSLSACQHGRRLLSQQRTPQPSRVWKFQQHFCHS